MKHGGGRVAVCREAAKDAPAHGHDQRSRHAFAGDICNDDTAMVLIHGEVIIVITADVSCGNVDPADLVARNVRCVGRQQDALDFVGETQRTALIASKITSGNGTSIEAASSRRVPTARFL